jgi:uncharacterized protein YdaU (DUF1376 family)
VSKQPFMPLFVGDFLASTVAWDGEEQGLYVLLLCYQWTSGPLPSDPARLCKMCRYDKARFAKLWATVSTKFEATDTGLVNVRLEAHREKSLQISNRRAQIGRLGGEAKAKQMAAAKHGKALANATDLPEQNSAIQSNPIHTRVRGDHSVDTSPLSLALQVETVVSTQPKVRATGQFIPDGFALTPERRRVAVAERVANPEREFERFTDYWRAASGANARKRDWDGTWRNWCRKAADMGGRPMGQARPTLEERLDAITKEPGL